MKKVIKESWTHFWMAASGSDLSWSAETCIQPFP
jgi:hypothetical protein